MITEKNFELTILDFTLPSPVSSRDETKPLLQRALSAPELSSFYSPSPSPSPISKRRTVLYTHNDQTHGKEIFSKIRSVIDRTSYIESSINNAKFKMLRSQSSILSPANKGKAALKSLSFERMTDAETMNYLLHLNEKLSEKDSEGFLKRKNSFSLNINANNEFEWVSIVLSTEEAEHVLEIILKIISSCLYWNVYEFQEIVPKGEPEWKKSLTFILDKVIENNTFKELIDNSIYFRKQVIESYRNIISFPLIERIQNSSRAITKMQHYVNKILSGLGHEQHLRLMKILEDLLSSFDDETLIKIYKNYSKNNVQRKTQINDLKQLFEVNCNSKKTAKKKHKIAYELVQLISEEKAIEIFKRLSQESISKGIDYDTQKKYLAELFNNPSTIYEDNSSLWLIPFSLLMNDSKKYADQYLEIEMQMSKGLKNSIKNIKNKARQSLALRFYDENNLGQCIELVTREPRKLAFNTATTIFPTALKNLVQRVFCYLLEKEKIDNQTFISSMNKFKEQINNNEWDSLIVAVNELAQHFS